MPRSIHSAEEKRMLEDQDRENRRADGELEDDFEDFPEEDDFLDEDEEYNPDEDLNEGEEISEGERPA